MKPISDTSARFHAAYARTILQQKRPTSGQQLLDMEKLILALEKGLQINGPFPFVEDAIANSTHSETN